jgi:hypothetical protein
VKASDSHPIAPARLAIVGSVLLAVLGTLGVMAAAGMLAPSGRQAAVRERGSQVMPFDLDRTTHVFEVTGDGGIEIVTVKDPTDKAQIALIQQHLEHEATKFRAGDFSDPAAIHGADMPGLQDLAAGAASIAFDYAPLPDGARITYTTRDAQLVAALHRWFAAQLADHGHDASAH